MSEQGWKQFLGSQDVDDWVVLHGGPKAVFKVSSLENSARLAMAIAAAPLSHCELLITISKTSLSVRITRDIWQIEPHHLEIARAISEIASQHGFAADRAGAQEVQVAIASKKEEMDVGFWRAVLGYVPAAIDNAVDPLGHSSTVWMQELTATKPLRHAMHIDVSVARENVKSRLAAAIAAGGRIIDESHAPSHWTLADRAGNRVCVCAWPDGFVDKQTDRDRGRISPDPSHNT
jgi:4a-hydroxytetrahydrobiopterin dehydratase